MPSNHLYPNNLNSDFITKVLMNRMRKAGVDMNDIEEEDHYSKYNLWNENIVPMVEMNTDIDEELTLNNLSTRWLTIKKKIASGKYSGGLGEYDGSLNNYDGRLGNYGRGPEPVTSTADEKRNSFENSTNYFDKLIIITSFGPFEGCSINPSWAYTESLKDIVVEWNCRIKCLLICLPVQYRKVNEIFREIIEEFPVIDLFICTGVCMSTTTLCLEEESHCYDRWVEDDCGDQPSINELIKLENGRTTIKLEEYISENIIKSKNCGQFLCNYIYLLTQNRNLKSIFIHVPAHMSFVKEFSEVFRKLLEIEL
ncbi:hypothetical protein SNEBB_007348 [Seison nebaliae]|nr:hypothetical protein SNEBB_007348 [Seison nebaliae]